MINIDLGVLLINFNRPQLTLNNIDYLRPIKPKRVFFSVDGPRDYLDYANVAECRSLAQTINWNCDLQTNFSNTNYGAAKWPVMSINWAFEFVQKLIVIEDDVVLHRQFFDLTEEVIERYFWDDKVFAFSAFNLAFLEKNNQVNNFYKSKYFSGWGWATTKDKWQLYDFDNLNYINFILLIKQNNFNLIIIFYFLLNYIFSKYKIIDAWDFQINNLLFNKNLYVIKSKYNLSKNVGFGFSATHTKFLPKFIISKFNFTKKTFPKNLHIDDRADKIWRKSVIKLLWSLMRKKFYV